MKSYIEYIQTKYSKILENEKHQLPRCLLVRHNSTDSLNSLNSMFSQRSYQSSANSSHAPHNTTMNSTNSDANSSSATSSSFDKSKKRSWLRSSFNKAFSRKQNSNSKSNSNKSDDGGSGKDKKYCLSDVEENDRQEQPGQNNRNNETEDSCNYSRGGDYSLPSSPLHQQIVIDQANQNKRVSNSNFISPNPTDIVIIIPVI